MKCPATPLNRCDPVLDGLPVLFYPNPIASSSSPLAASSPCTKSDRATVLAAQNLDVHEVDVGLWPSASCTMISDIRPGAENPATTRQPVRHEVVTHVLGTFRYPCLRAGQAYRGGEGGIRTPDRLAPMPHFECGAFNHSATSPRRAKSGANPRGRGRVLGEDGRPDKARKQEFRKDRREKNKKRNDHGAAKRPHGWPEFSLTWEPVMPRHCASQRSAGADRKLIKGGTAGREKNRRSRAASLQSWPGRAASPVSLMRQRRR